jgi:hypothetical protein
MLDAFTTAAPLSVDLYMATHKSEEDTTVGAAAVATSSSSERVAERISVVRALRVVRRCARPDSTHSMSPPSP